MITLRPPRTRISDAGGFLDSGTIDVEHVQQWGFVAIRIGAYLTEGFLIQMERDLERGIVAPKADAVSCRTVISASVWKMECHRCSHRYCAAGRLMWRVGPSGGGQPSPQRQICLSHSRESPHEARPRWYARYETPSIWVLERIYRYEQNLWILDTDGDFFRDHVCVSLAGKSEKRRLTGECRVIACQHWALSHSHPGAFVARLDAIVELRHLISRPVEPRAIVSESATYLGPTVLARSKPGT